MAQVAVIYSKTNVNTETTMDTSCYHCGDPVRNNTHESDGHYFCCLGCHTVYQVLRGSNMGNYYRYNPHPGRKQGSEARFEYLDEPQIAERLLDFRNEAISIVTFYIPVIHCSSCIWLLEHLYKLNPAIVASQSDFLKKQVTITFRHYELNLRSLVELLHRIGYTPRITLQDDAGEIQRFSQRRLITRIAVAGFCFGNSMMLSFPEYFGMAEFEIRFSIFFGWMNLAFSTVALCYSGLGYLTAAWKSLRRNVLDLNVPLAIGLAVLFGRTAWEVLTGTGPGFGDTLCGLVFFLLVGRFVQQRTYHHISFERDYRSYFPIAVTCIRTDGSKAVPLGDIGVGDRLFIRNNELVPADAILMKGEASVDFSFVTGESAPVRKVPGEIIYAGGRQVGEAIEVEVVKPVSQSYLMQLWNNEATKSYDKPFETFSNRVSRYFTPVLLFIALAAMGYWFIYDDVARAWGALTAVLIIACPCALALSSPFTLSAVLGVFDRHGFYAKNTAVVEQMAGIDCFVFDKTGTISSPTAARLAFEGQLSAGERAVVASVCRNSVHPLSRGIVEWAGELRVRPVDRFREIQGLGLSAEVDGKEIRIGSRAFTGFSEVADADSGQVYVTIGGQLKGWFTIEQLWRPGLRQTIRELGHTYDTHLLSGDNDRMKDVLRRIFPAGADLLFRQLPGQKLDYVRSWRQRGRRVCMIGDGLNDAGALRAANVGIAVTDDVSGFSPGSDAILDGRSFRKLPRFFRLAKDAVGVIRKSFAISLVYNVVGLGFAVMGTMSPLVAAVLMPLSTVTIISFTTLAVQHYAARNQL